MLLTAASRRAAFSAGAPGTAGWVGVLVSVRRMDDVAARETFMVIQQTRAWLPWLSLNSAYADGPNTAKVRPSVVPLAPHLTCWVPS